MKIHANAKTCPQSRRLLIRRIEEGNWPLMKAAEAAGISGRSASQSALHIESHPVVARPFLAMTGGYRPSSRWTGGVQNLPAMRLSADGCQARSKTGPLPTV